LKPMKSCGMMHNSITPNQERIMKAIILGCPMGGFELVTKDDGSLWEDGDNSFFEAMNMLREKHKGGDNVVMEIGSYTLSDELNVQPLVEGVDY
jgi:hypothetical protein